MSGSRERILAGLRRTLGRADDPGRAGAVDRWLRETGRGPLPRIADDVPGAFAEKAQAAAAEVHRVRDDARAVQMLLDATPVGAALVAAPDERLRGLPWPAQRRPEMRKAGASDPVCVSVAWAGIAETGSLVLLSGPDTPTGLGFLPDHLLCLLDCERILPHPEDVWARLRAELQTMPRGVNLLTGPSRTADVEQTIQLGAHGPRRLSILLVGG
ncbi:MAG: LUD domain-containing protein [Chromatiales bacterium]|jgi:L-lactate dehydrogenase complex protein LldG